MKKFISILTLFIAVTTVMAQDIPEPMSPPRMVNDFSGLLGNGQRQKLETKLQEFYYQTSTQIFIVILDDISGYDISDFSFRLGEKWGIGTKGKDNGVLILMNPSADRKHGDVFIASGYGLEAVVPDAKANRIVDYDMIPHFRELDYYGGLNAAVSTIMELTRGEYTMDEYVQRKETESSPVAGILVFLFFLFIFSVLGGRSRARRHHSMGHSLPFWTALFLASGAGRSHSGNFGNFSSGGGSFGGFGGGMGGGFGGGGAGGSW